MRKRLPCSEEICPSRILSVALAVPFALAVAACTTSDGAPGGAVDAGSAQSDAGSSADAVGSTDDARVDAPSASDATAGADASLVGWTLTWSDEFNAADGTPADATKWTNDVSGNGNGNHEREFYTAGAANAVQRGGSLVITATTAGASAHTCWYGPCLYTSARLVTKGHFAQKYGRMSARIQLPSGQGMWPAFWMLGDDIDTKQWPACGEIDVMENIGKEPSTNHGTLHATGYAGAGLGGAYALPGQAKLSDDFHVYAIEWDAAGIRFYVDSALYETRTPADVPQGGTWPFDHPFFLLLNVAVGGDWPGDPDATTVFPQTMRVDWVRVYTKS